MFLLTGLHARPETGRTTVVKPAGPCSGLPGCRHLVFPGSPDMLVSRAGGGIAVPASEYPCQMIGRVPVLTAPAEIDITTSGALRAILFQWHSQGHRTVLVDLTGTVYCDVSGLRELLRAHNRAAADGGGLRLVTRADGTFVRAFTVTGLDGVIPRFPTVQQALAQVPAAIDSLHLDPARESRAQQACPPAHVRKRRSPVANNRRCEQCGAPFVPLREHARFCTSDCRAAWNRGHLSDPAVDASALTWSIAAMSAATARLPGVK